MASTDLKTFLENRLTVLDPSIDLSAGSPAQVQFISPVISYLGTDPIETDIKTFILDRFQQEFPEVFSGDPGVVSDTFIKPTILMLEPFKREIQSIKRNQSLKDPTLLSDDDADALVANFFDERRAGGLSSGIARVYFANPSNVQVEPTSRVFTASGLNFFPVSPSAISAEEMVFNKTGGLYFMDFMVQAEATGTEYNISKNSLTGVQGISGAIKVDNPRDFTDGTASLSTETFVDQARGSLTERSLVTRRGATAILRENFQGMVRAVQVIGAGDPEMQRDILSATSPGHAFLTGKVGIYKQMAYVRCRTMDVGDASEPVVAPGDQVYLYLNQGLYPLIPQQNRFVRLTIAEVILGPLQHATSPEFQVSYLLRYVESPPAALVGGAYFEGGIIKKGTVTVSSLPGALLSDPVTVRSQKVHLLGHSDVYVRPVSQTVSTVVVNSLSADPGDSSLQRFSLSTFASNRVTDSINFDSAKVRQGDYLIIESGVDVGSYTIKAVNGSSLYLGSNLTATATNVKYRIISNLTFNPFAPRVLKIPFGTVPHNDLQTVIGSKTFTLTAPSSDLLNYGVKVGDVLKLSSAIDPDEFTITGFIDGQHVLVDRAAAGSESGISYEIYTPLEAVQRPLVRIKELQVLDSAKQVTGVSIPPSEPVGVVPAGNFTSAQVVGFGQKASAFILPDLTPFVVALPSVSRSSSPPGRYSAAFLKSIGFYGAVVFEDVGVDGRPSDEFDYIPSMFGQCSYVVLTAEDTTDVENFPPVDPKPGDALTLKSGPNAGNYLIKDVIKFRYWVTGAQVWAYIVQVYGSFRVDVLGQLTAFLNDTEGLFPGTGCAVPKLDIMTADVTVPSYLQTTLYSTMGTKLRLALAAYGVSPLSLPSAAELQTAIDSMFLLRYEYGTPARGVLRTFFSHPTLFQQNTSANLNPTTYSFKTPAGDLLKFRTDPSRYSKHEMVPPRLESDSDPLLYPRDGEQFYLIHYSANTVPFTVGATLIGPTTTATIVADSREGTTGVLTVRSLTGSTSMGVSITDDSGTGASAILVGLERGVTFSSSSRESMFNLGIRPGDVFGVHEEFKLHGSYGTAGTGHKNYMSSVQTVFNSTQVTFPNSPSPFVPDMVGGMLFIEEGKDKGGYRIVKVIDGKNLVLDAPMTESTPTAILSGSIVSYGYTLSQNRVTSLTPVFTPAHVNKYLTMYGVDLEFQGSYRIKSVPAPNIVELDRSAFSDFPSTAVPNGLWVITDAPSAEPKKLGSPATGTELVATRPIRIYRNFETEMHITLVDPSPDVSTIGLGVGALGYGVKEPFRIFRPDVRRVNPYEMSLSQMNGLYYFDSEVVSLGPNPSNNLSTNSYLTVDEGTYESDGYHHLVDDYTLTYSTQETGKLFIPSSILPLSSPDSLDNRLSLVGVPLQISYERGDVVQQVQDFLSSPEDRTTTANMLARHFLPSYVYYSADYIGGSDAGVIAKDIISHIDNLAVETAIDVSVVQKLIENRGGNVETPTAIAILLHDWDRRQWVEFSENRIGGTVTLVPYNGTPRVSYFVPGPDVSGQSPIPDGERTYLNRL